MNSKSEDNDSPEYIQEYIGANSVKKGSIVMLKNRPCRISDIAISKPGKHGSAKAVMTGYDIITDKKIQTFYITSDNVPVPKIEKQVYLLMDINDDILTVLDNSGKSQDYKFNCDNELQSKIIESFSNPNNETYIEILTCIGHNRITDLKNKL